MLNRSMPTNAIIVVLEYPDVRAAVDWLCRAFGFCERLRMGTHRAQLTFGAGSIVVTELHTSVMNAAQCRHSIMVRVTDATAHHAAARAAGALALDALSDYPYGERQYSVEDPWHHRWTFSETIADVDPTQFGGVFLPRPSEV